MSSVREVSAEWSWRGARTNPARMAEVLDRKRDRGVFDDEERVRAPAWRSARVGPVQKVDRKRVRLVAVGKLVTVLLDNYPLFQCRADASWDLLMRQQGYIVT